jgi:Na+-transporting NADH:ubiquinone oxidoreductase subunit NqrD
VQGVPSAAAGAASGLLNTSRLLGGAVGLAVLTTIADTRTHAALMHGARPLQALTDGYGRALLVAAVIVAFGAIAAVVSLREKGSAQQPAEAASW